jgi:hypothetical protein
MRLFLRGMTFKKKNGVRIGKMVEQKTWSTRAQSTTSLDAAR